jgi:Rrf2 family transcriptional regulator, cysteine metabolism repressor
MVGLTTKGRYATRLLVYLATRQEGGPVKKQDIAASEGITPDYVEQILIRLKAAGLVRSYRGKDGGFSLAVDPGALTVARVLEAMEGKMSVVPCLESGACERAGSCSTRALWRKADQALKQVFAKATIGELAAGARKGASFDI